VSRFAPTPTAFLLLSSSLGTAITDNTFYGDGDGFVAIDFFSDDYFGTAPSTIANNTITMTGANTVGIQVSLRGPADPGAQMSVVTIRNNAINTNGAGMGLQLRVGAPDFFAALVQGNDLHNNKIGIAINGSGTSAGTIDLGGGTLGSLGGNDFRGFTSLGTTSSAAILLTDTTISTAIPAAGNIFQSQVSPPFVIDDGVEGSLTGTGQINAAMKLDDAHAFVQTLYNNLLGRTGTRSELDGWVSLLNRQGRTAVVEGILYSGESLGRIVDQLYLRFLGRNSDAAGRAGWISFLQHGGTEEQVETLFLTSPEYVSHINVDYVQSLYINILGRPGSPDELAAWNNNIQNVGGLAGVANAFVRSPENRLNTLRSDFQTFLHRTPTDTELMPLVNSPLSLLALEDTVLSSPEFFANG
jgi:hypothetical protein